ncbi:hypothetical protein SNE40_003992 [Patella caerulea]|uniref:Kazal-like domain-containing protein n=1 Tax=Patella caerulea TaxID=87958 RepID=A0AAN8Q999_PATCE
MKLFILSVVSLFTVGCWCAPTTEEACLLACPFIWMPVCGDNGVTYSNTCTMESLTCMQNIQVEITHDGACDTIPQQF